MIGEMSVLDRSGDTRIQWNKMNPDELAAAENRFNEYKGRGFAAFKVNKKGDKGEQIDAFDPDAERIILVPALVGG